MRECRCTPQQVARYRDKFSGPLRDRIDLTAEVPAVPVSSLTTGAGGESSSTVRARVVAARKRQRDRYAADGIRTNAELTPSLLMRDGPLDVRAARVIDATVTSMALSARAYDRGPRGGGRRRRSPLRGAAVPDAGMRAGRSRNPVLSRVMSGREDITDE